MWSLSLRMLVIKSSYSLAEKDLQMPLKASWGKESIDHLRLLIKKINDNAYVVDFPNWNTFNIDDLYLYLLIGTQVYMPIT